MLNKAFYALMDREPWYCPGRVVVINTLCYEDGVSVIHHLVEDCLMQCTDHRVLTLCTKASERSLENEKQIIVPATTNVDDLGKLIEGAVQAVGSGIMVIINDMVSSARPTFIRALRELAVHQGVAIVITNQFSISTIRELSERKVQPVDVMNINEVGYWHHDPRFVLEVDVMLNVAIDRTQGKALLYASASKVRSSAPNAPLGTVVQIDHNP